MRNTPSLFLAVVVVFVGGPSAQAGPPETVGLVPQPAHVSSNTGRFVLSEGVTIRVHRDSADAANVADSVGPPNPHWHRAAPGNRTVRRRPCE